MKRLIEEVEDPRLERLALHLRQIAAPLPAPSPRALGEIAARVLERSAPRRGRILLAAAAAAMVALWLAAPARRPIVAVDSPGRASGEPARVPAIVQIPSQPREPLKLSAGHLVMRADEQPATVEVPGGHVVVPPGGRARIEVRGYSVRIAAWRGSVMVAWNGTTVVIPAGETRTLGADDPVDANAHASANAHANANANANTNTNANANANAHANANANANVSDEAALLSRALRLLRVDQDADGALRLLDEHDRRFPTGALSTEAQRLRREAGDEVANGP